jgi:hypothetical protein
MQTLLSKHRIAQVVDADLATPEQLGLMMAGVGAEH